MKKTAALPRGGEQEQFLDLQYKCNGKKKWTHREEAPKKVFADNQKEDQTVSHYKHLAIEERESLYLWINQGKSIRRIARELKRSASTLSRELSRNKISHRPYSPSRAQRRYQRCKQNCGRKPILANKESLVLIRRLLREEWSPEEIQYRLKREENSLQISYTTIYRALSSGVSWGTGKAIR